jgi:hypothetical protein
MGRASDEGDMMAVLLRVTGYGSGETVERGESRGKRRVSLTRLVSFRSRIALLCAGAGGRAIDGDFFGFFIFGFTV